MAADPPLERGYLVSPQLVVRVRGPADVHRWCGPHVFTPYEGRAAATVDFTEGEVHIEAAAERFPVVHPTMRWLEDGAAFVEAALHACALETVWRDGGILIHGAGFLGASGALLALADSGGGKSTLTNLAGERFVSLSDETLRLDLSGAPALAATSFRSDSPLRPACERGLLRALLILEKASVPALQRLPESAAVQALMAQAYRPRGGHFGELMRRVASVAREVRAFRFAFPKSPEAVGLLEEVLARAG